MYYKPYFSQRGVACKTNVLHVWFQFTVSARTLRTLHSDVTTWRMALGEPRFYATVAKR